MALISVILLIPQISDHAADLMWLCQPSAECAKLNLTYCVSILIIYLDYFAI